MVFANAGNGGVTMRLVDADELEHYFMTKMRYLEKDQVMDAAYMVNKAPTVDAKPVVHAEWKPYHDYFTKKQVGWICTNCSGVHEGVHTGDTYFCPHCGATMDGDDDG